jgi:hypothetical protein
VAAGAVVRWYIIGSRVMRVLVSVQTRILSPDQAPTKACSKNIRKADSTSQRRSPYDNFFPQAYCYSPFFMPIFDATLHHEDRN